MCFLTFSFPPRLQLLDPAAANSGTKGNWLEAGMLALCRCVSLHQETFFWQCDCLSSLLGAVERHKEIYLFANCKGEKPKRKHFHLALLLN